jgi:hypothetical protein
MKAWTSSRVPHVTAAQEARARCETPGAIPAWSVAVRSVLCRPRGTRYRGFRRLATMCTTISMSRSVARRADRAQVPVRTTDSRAGPFRPHPDTTPPKATGLSRLAIGCTRRRNDLGGDGYSVGDQTRDQTRDQTCDQTRPVISKATRYMAGLAVNPNSSTARNACCRQSCAAIAACSASALSHSATLIT